MSIFTIERTPMIPTHPALLVLDYEDMRTDVHGIAADITGRNAAGLHYFQYACHCGYQTDECATDFDATAHLISHAIKSPKSGYAVIATRTDSTWRAIDGENLTAGQAMALIACNREVAEGKHLRNAAGELIPYLSVARWAMVPQLAA